MLVNQGVISIRHWTGVDADPAVMRRKVEELFGLLDRLEAHGRAALRRVLRRRVPRLLRFSASWCSMSCTTAPVMMPTTSCIECSFGSTTATRLPSRWMWIRSAISNTCGMLWLIRITGRPVVAHALDQLEHLAGLLDAERGGRLVHDHELARPRGGARHRDALALAARERLHRLAHGADADLQALHLPDGLLLLALVVEHPQDAPERPARRFSRPRNRLVAMSSAGATARSW